MLSVSERASKNRGVQKEQLCGGAAIGLPAGSEIIFGFTP